MTRERFRGSMTIIKRRVSSIRRCVRVSLSTKLGIIRLCPGPACRSTVVHRRSRWHCCRRFVRKQHFRRSRWRQEEGLTYLRHNKNGQPSLFAWDDPTFFPAPDSLENIVYVKKKVNTPLNLIRSEYY